MNGYVSYEGRRYRVVGSHVTQESNPSSDILRLRPFKGADVQAPAIVCTPWKRHGTRTIRGKSPHRDGRPVIFSYDSTNGVIEVRLKGKRKRFSTTLGGIFDLLARQTAMNAKRDRAFAKRTRR